MPISPVRHNNSSVGLSHVDQVRRKRANQLALKRQKKRMHATNSGPWIAIINTHKQANPNNLLCASCAINGISTLMSDVDHIDGDTYNNDPENLQSLCRPCHSKKTALEDGGFGNKQGGGSKK